MYKQKRKKKRRTLNRHKWVNNMNQIRLSTRQDRDRKEKA